MLMLILFWLLLLLLFAAVVDEVMTPLPDATLAMMDVRLEADEGVAAAAATACCTEAGTVVALELEGSMTVMLFMLTLPTF